MVEQSREHRRGQPAALERNRSPLRGTDADHDVHRVSHGQVERRCGVGVRGDGPRSDQAGAHPNLRAAHLLGEPGEAGEVAVEPGRAHERAATAAGPPLQGAARLHGRQRLAQRHPADAEPRGQRVLARQAIALAERPAGDLAREPALDPHVRRHPGRRRQVRCAPQPGLRLPRHGCGPGQLPASAVTASASCALPARIASRRPSYGSAVPRCGSTGSPRSGARVQPLPSAVNDVCLVR